MIVLIASPAQFRDEGRREYVGDDDSNDVDNRAIYYSGTMGHARVVTLFLDRHDTALVRLTRGEEKIFASERNPRDELNSRLRLRRRRRRIRRRVHTQNRFASFVMRPVNAHFDPARNLLYTDIYLGAISSRATLFFSVSGVREPPPTPLLLLLLLA